MNRHHRAILFSVYALLALGWSLKDPTAADAKPLASPAAVSEQLFSILVVPSWPQVASEQQDKPAKTSELPLPEGKGRDVTKRLCSKCHVTNTFAAQRHTREQWSSIIDNMVSKGLEASDEELDQITDYLATSFPPSIKRTSPDTPDTQHLSQ